MRIERNEGEVGPDLPVRKRTCEVLNLEHREAFRFLGLFKYLFQREGT